MNGPLACLPTVSSLPGTDIRQVGDVGGQHTGGAMEEPLGLALRLHLTYKYKKHAADIKTVRG